MLFPIEDVFDIKYEVELSIQNIYGGVPQKKEIVEGWIKTVLGISRGEQISQEVRELINQTILDRFDGDVESIKGTQEERVAQISAAIEESGAAILNGFKRLQPSRELYIEGRQVKAMIKEAANTAVAEGAITSRGWGKTNKGLMGFLPEHVFVPEQAISLGVTEPTDTDTNFVHTFRGSSIKREEYVENVTISFTVVTDHDFGDDFWKQVWTRAQLNGLGASRSQGRGCFEVTRWDKIK